MYVYTWILLYIYYIYDVYMYIHILFICIYLRMYTNVVVVACDPSHTLWRVATAVRMRNDHWHAWTKKPWRISLHLPIWTVFRQQWWAAPVWYFRDIFEKFPKLGIQKKNRIHDMSIRIYIYYVFFWVEGFRIMFSASNLRTTYPKYFHPVVFSHKTLCVPRWRAPGWAGIGGIGGHVGMVDCFW